MVVDGALLCIAVMQTAPLLIHKGTSFSCQAVKHLSQYYRQFLAINT
jgi:hypothetical protein